MSLLVLLRVLKVPVPEVAELKMYGTLLCSALLFCELDVFVSAGGFVSMLECRCDCRTKTDIKRLPRRSRFHPAFVVLGFFLFLFCQIV